MKGLRLRMFAVALLMLACLSSVRAQESNGADQQQTQTATLVILDHAASACGLEGC
jgi:hypothetical protein